VVVPEKHLYATKENHMKKLILAALLCSVSSRAFANNIVAGVHPPIGEKGYALQVDNRIISQHASVFVNRMGKTSHTHYNQFSNLLIGRVFIPGWLFRLSVPYTEVQDPARTRSSFGDVLAEAGASDEWNGWHYRALAFVCMPGEYSSNRLNVGTGAWSIGPNASLTRYFADKKYNASVWAQYAFNFANPETQIRAGNIFSYAVATTRRFDLGGSVMAGIEHRGLMADPNTKDSDDVSRSKRQLSAGPVMMINLNRVLPGFSLWPTAQYDFYNRNTSRMNLHYLKLQYVW
jgi:hypothetical protein